MRRTYPFLLLLAASILLHHHTSNGAPVEVNPTGLSGAVQPQVAVAPNGHIHVTFGKGNAIYHVASVNRGQTFSDPVKVGELPKLALGMRRGPRIVASDRVLAITAISLTDGNLHAWYSKDNGATWQETAHVNDAPKAAREGLHAMAGDGNGNIILTWLDLRNGGTELWRATSANGGETWGINGAIYKSPDGHICECCHPSTAMDAQGRTAVMWRNWLGGSRDMYAALSTDHGKTFSAARKLGSETWKLKGCPMDGGSIALNGTGDPIGLWRRERKVLAGDFDSEQILADNSSQPIVAVGEKQRYQLWESAGGLMLRRGTDAPTLLAEGARFASASVLPAGELVVAWESRLATSMSIFVAVVD